MKPRVFITGTGIISAIGRSVDETIFSLSSCKTGISEMKFLDSRLKDMFPVGEVKYSNSELSEMLSLSDGRYSRTFLLSLAAAREAAGDRLQNYNPDRIGFVSGNTVGGMDLTENYFQSVHSGIEEDISGLIQHDCGYSSQKVAGSLNISGYVTTISTACSSSANSIMHGAMLIRAGLADAVIAGGVDSLTRFTLNGFNSLKILDSGLTAPFDDNRNGLNLGEGAAYLFLESEESAAGHMQDVICEVRGFGNSCDAFHQTAMSEDGRGPKLAMRGALKSAGLASDQIDYINLHGTGTSNNDLSEGLSIEDVFDGNIPLYSSTKSYTGHTLGAAGAVEAVISALTIRNGIIFPNINFKKRMKELSVDPVSALCEKKDIRNVMSNSFGFGGNNSSIIFSKVV